MPHYEPQLYPSVGGGVQRSSHRYLQAVCIMQIFMSQSATDAGDRSRLAPATGPVMTRGTGCNTKGLVLVPGYEAFILCASIAHGI